MVFVRISINNVHVISEIRKYLYLFISLIIPNYLPNTAIVIITIALLYFDIFYK